MSATSASEALARFARAWREPHAAALSFKAQGGRVVGYLTANAPVELIEAGGMFALRLDGGGLAETPRADAFVEALFDPTVRGVCEMLLAGELDFLDALILPRTTDSVQRLYYYLCEQKRLAGLQLPRLIFYDLLHTPGAASAAHNEAALAQVRDALAEVSGRATGDEALLAAIQVSNRRREALRACVAARRFAGLSGVEALQVMAASRRMAPASFIAAADALAPALEAREVAGPRVVIAGNAPDTDDLHRAIEEAGAVVVGDYHDRGEPSMGASIALTQPPLRGLSAHYHQGSPSPRSFPAQPEALASFVREVSAVGVIFFYYAQEEVLTWEYPGQRDALGAAGVASFCLAGQPYRIDRAAVRDAIAPFLATLT